MNLKKFIFFKTNSQISKSSQLKNCEFEKVHRFWKKNASLKKVPGSGKGLSILKTKHAFEKKSQIGKKFTSFQEKVQKFEKKIDLLLECRGAAQPDAPPESYDSLL